MNDYESLVMAARNKMLKLTIEQQKEIAKIYEDSIKELSDKAAAAKDKSLTQRWYMDYAKNLQNARDKLNISLSGKIKNAIRQTGNYAVEPDAQILKNAFYKIGIDVGPHFTDMFSQVPENVLTIMENGDIYKDDKGLSNRIWNISNEYKQNIDYVIKKAITEQKSAYELAKDLETFVKPTAQRPWSWGNVYPNMRNKQIDYNAQRLARTSITHGFREAQNKSAEINPFIEAMHWELSSQHYERQIKNWGEDICDEYARHDEGFGKGNFRKGEVPVGHPQCLCVTYAIIPQTYDEMADELRDWADGESDDKLDEWYNRYKTYLQTI
ncbi:MAG: hypothetical protein QME45_04300 [Clostridiales bacterium]|nr:hypothetical protein [Clostridiales bacterium]